MERLLKQLNRLTLEKTRVVKDLDKIMQALELPWNGSLDAATEANLKAYKIALKARRRLVK